MTWVLLLGRVDRSRKPWQIRRSVVHYVCSRHFLGNRRLDFLILIAIGIQIEECARKSLNRSVLCTCSTNFSSSPRLLIPETDHYYPSIFPAISNENCLPNVRPGEEKCALYPRPAGFYKHKPILKEVRKQSQVSPSVFVGHLNTELRCHLQGSSENVADVKIYRESLPGS